MSLELSCYLCIHFGICDNCKKKYYCTDPKRLKQTEKKEVCRLCGCIIPNHLIECTNFEKDREETYKEELECPSCNGILTYQEDGRWFVCNNCKECFAETDYRLKASGGEKDPVEGTHEGLRKDKSLQLELGKSQDSKTPYKSTLVTATDSKPPEPKWTVEYGKTEPKPGEHFILRGDGTPNNPILRALFFGGDEEYIIDWKFRYKRKYFEIVKREDLQFF